MTAPMACPAWCSYHSGGGGDPVMHLREVGPMGTEVSILDAADDDPPEVTVCLPGPRGWHMPVAEAAQLVVELQRALAILRDAGRH